MKKRVLAIMLVCFMLVSLLPMGAFAADEVNCPGTGNKHYLEHLEGECEFVRHEESKSCGGFNYDVYQCDSCGDYFAANITSNGQECVMETVKAPTCTEAGEKKCAACGTTEEIPATGHTKGEGVAAGDCTTGVTVTYKCTACGEVVETVAGQAGHNLTTVPEISEDEKWGYYYCTNEGCDYVKEVPVYDHFCAWNIVTIPQKDATCTETGLTAYDTCAICGANVTEPEVIPATGHDKLGKVFKIADEPIMVGGEYGYRYFFSVEEDTEVTFYTENEETWVTIQQEVYDEEWQEYSWVNKFAENIETNSIVYFDMDEDGKEDGLTFKLEAGVQYRLTNWNAAAPIYQGGYFEGCVDVAGDCDTMPSKMWNCSVCGEDWYEYFCATCGEAECDHEDLEKYGHTLKCFQDIKPTCSEYGFYVIGCTVCGQMNENQKLDKLPHNYEEVVDQWETCTKPGHYNNVCVDCGHTVEGGVRPAAGHNLYTVNVPSTCKVPGYTLQVCLNGEMCDEHFGYYYDEANWAYFTNVVEGSFVQLELDPTAHNGHLYKSLNEPTCTKKGNNIYLCDDCHEYYAVEIPANGHDHYVVETPATCISAGYSEKYCYDCDYYEFIEGEPALEATKDGLNENGQAFTLEEAEAEHVLMWDTYVSIRDESNANMCEVVGLFELTCERCLVSILIETPGTGEHTHGALDAYDSNWVSPYTEAQAATASKLNGTYSDWWGEMSFTFVPNETLTAGVLSVYLLDVQYDENWNPIETLYEATFDYSVNEYGTIELILVDGVAPNNLYLQVMAYGLYVEYPVEGQQWPVSAYLQNYVGETLVLQTEQEYAAKAPNCTEEGWEAHYYCTRCGEYQDGAEFEALGHTPSADADCLNDSYCTVCGDIVDPALGHKWNIADVAPTCTEAGYTVKTCETCGAVEVVAGDPALGHDHVIVDFQEYIAYFNSIEDYLYQFGYEHYECSRCEDGFIVNYKPVECEHVFVRNDWNDMPAVDCQTPNQIAYDCELCGHTEFVDGEDFLPHMNANGDVLTEDCTSLGVEDRVCAACGETFLAKEHDYVVTSYAATCKNVAYDMYQCSVCAHNYAVKTGTEYAPHNMNEWAWVNGEPDYGTDAEQVRGCDHCDYVEYRTVSVNGIAYNTEIKNSLDVAGAEIANGSTIQVIVSVIGSNDNIWGFDLDLKYDSEALEYVGAEYGDLFATTAKDNDGYVSIVGYNPANEAADVVLNGEETLVVLTFKVKAVGEFSIELVEDTKNAKGEDVEAAILGDRTASAIMLMDMDGNGKIDLSDAVAVYNLMFEIGAYKAAADVDFNGKIDLDDFLAVYNWLLSDEALN